LLACFGGSARSPIAAKVALPSCSGLRLVTVTLGLVRSVVLSMQRAIDGVPEVGRILSSRRGGPGERMAQANEGPADTSRTSPDASFIPGLVERHK
jgi:hypothetical protein